MRVYAVRPALVRATPASAAFCRPRSAAAAVAPKRRLLSGGAAPPDDEPRFLDMVKMNFERAAAHTDLAPGMVKQIMACNSVLRVSFPIQRVRLTLGHAISSLLAVPCRIANRSKSLCELRFWRRSCCKVGPAFLCLCWKVVVLR